MTNFGERLKALAVKLGKDDQDVAYDLGLSKAQMSHYTTGKRKVPSELLQKIVDIYGINPQFLFDKEAPLYFEQKNINNSVVRELPELYITYKDTSTFPYYPISIAAGLPSICDSVMEEDVEILEIPNFLMGKYAGADDVYLTKINGDSMNNIFPDGSLIAVKHIELSNLKDNDIVIFSDQNNFSVKRFINDIENKRFIFRPDSNDQSFIDYVINYNNAQDLKIHGKVVLYMVSFD